MDQDHPPSAFRNALALQIHTVMTKLTSIPDIHYDPPADAPVPPQPDALLVLLPLLIVLSTFLLLLLTFLVCVLLLRRRRGIILRDHDGPVDMSREELIEGEGGFEGVESRWLENVQDNVRRDYLRAKEYQLQYPPNSLPTDITLSQFLSIQEKGVSAWSFEPDYETVNSLIVHARTEITFLPDPASSSCVQSNLPLPKLNEVYYWEVKMFDLPETTVVSVGLATKPYPPFCVPGHSRHSIAYHSSGDKSFNYPFTSTQFGPVLKEGDVLGVGYRPRTGTVFFTRNGRKLEDAFVGLSRWNLFPAIGADGPCSVHVNLGQSGFVFIEANVKKWGLAPSVGTLAPPPAYGSERGSILLDVGGRVRQPGDGSLHPNGARRSRRRGPGIPSSPLRSAALSEPAPLTPPPPITPIDEHPESLYETDDGSEDPSQPLLSTEENAPSSPARSARSVSPDAGARNPFANPRIRHSHSQSISHFASSLSGSRSDLMVHLHPPPDSPLSPSHNPPTPHPRDIHLQALNSGHRRSASDGSSRANNAEDRLASPSLGRRDPPAYSPLDAFTYADGVHIDLPAEVIAAAVEGTPLPETAVGQANPSRSSDRRRTRRR